MLQSKRTVLIILVALLQMFLFMQVSVAQEAPATVPGQPATPQTLTPAPLVQWILQGRTRLIQQRLQMNRWPIGTPERSLAQAVLEPDGNKAFSQFKALSRSPSVSDSIVTVAWFHLYGYYRLKGDAAGQTNALEMMRENLPLAQALFQGPLPPPPSTDPLDFLMHEDESTIQPDPDAGRDPNGVYSLQLGAFSSQANAERFASSRRSLGIEVFVHPVPRGSSTLYTVRAGHFTTESQALEFGTRRIGTAGKDFSVVRNH